MSLPRLAGLLGVSVFLVAAPLAATAEAGFMSGWQGYTFAQFPGTSSPLHVNYAVWERSSEPNGNVDWAQEIQTELGVTGFKSAVRPLSDYNPDAKYVYFYSVHDLGALSDQQDLDYFQLPLVKIDDDRAGHVDNFLFQYDGNAVPGEHGTLVGGDPAKLSFVGDTQGSALEPSASILGSVAHFSWTGFNTSDPNVTYSSVFFVASDTEPLWGSAVLEGTFTGNVQRVGFAYVPLAFTPEPSSLLLMCAAFAGAACVRFGRRRKWNPLPRA